MRTEIGPYISSIVQRCQQLNWEIRVWKMYDGFLWRCAKAHRPISPPKPFLPYRWKACAFYIFPLNVNFLLFKLCVFVNNLVGPNPLCSSIWNATETLSSQPTCFISYIIEHCRAYHFADIYISINFAVKLCISQYWLWNMFSNWLLNSDYGFSTNSLKKKQNYGNKSVIQAERRQ